MPVMLICELPGPAPSEDDDVIDDVPDRPSISAVSIVTSDCERPRNILHPVDLRRRRRRRRRGRGQLNSDSDQSRSPLLSNASSEYLVDFAVCVPPLFGNVSATDMVEFIEVNRMFGASKFQFYVQSSTPELETCLNKYRQLGIVDVQPWPLPESLLHPQMMHYHGQVLAINECGYRQMYDAKYMLSHDIDEFVVPTLAEDWSSMLDDFSNSAMSDVQRDRIASYSFRNRFFPLGHSYISEQDVPTAVARYRFRTLTKAAAEKRLYPRDERGKTMSRPERVVIWYTHSVLDSSLIRSSDVNVFVDNDVAELVHYTHMTVDESFDSTQITRFKSRIVQRLQIGMDICLL